MQSQARVFQKDGNKFLVPGYWCPVDVEEQEKWEEKGGWSYSTILCEAMMFGVINGCDSHQECEYDVPDDGTISITHVKYKLGMLDVLLIDGPLFAEAVSAHPEPVS